MKYGLIGEKLSHSYSKLIHEALTSIPYELIEIQPCELPSFLKKRAFTAINVTIPYKESVIPFLDVIDQSAQAIGSVNTIVNRNGKLFGFNTDYLGFTFLLKHNNIDVHNKKIMILGNGGTSKTVQFCMNQLGAKKIIIVSRSASVNDTTIPYGKVYEYNDVDIIINTTPVGMSPDDNISPLDVSKMSAPVVIDVIYNPHRTMLLQQAAAAGKKAIGGFAMLVAQAVYASQLFHNTIYEASRIDQLTRDLLIKQTNIVLIGMPGCGKSSIGKSLSASMDKSFVDTDMMIETTANTTIPSIFQRHGEEFFRQLEYEAICQASKLTNSVISTGGGVIRREQNIIELKKRGFIFYIQRNVECLDISDTRPLSASFNDNVVLFKQREPLYLKYADVVIENEQSIDDAIMLIKEKLYEAIGD